MVILFVWNDICCIWNIILCIKFLIIFVLVSKNNVNSLVLKLIDNRVSFVILVLEEKDI